METNSNQNTAALIHLSSLSQYMIPFGNFIFPVIIWSSTKDRSEFINQQGKKTINFQLSLFLYSFVICLIALPIIVFNVLNQFSFSELTDGGLVLDNLDFAQISSAFWFAIFALTIVGMLKVAEFFLIIYAAVKTSSGLDFQYPFTIPFIK